MLARTPWVKPLKIAPPKPKRLGKDRVRSIREKIVDVMRDAEPTPFAAEGPCRHGIRSSLCLQGWPWLDADTAAAEIVIGALNIAGAKRPTWKEGQPEWTQDAALPILRERCIRCRKPLPDGHWKFCSSVCSQAHHKQYASLDAKEREVAQNRARVAAWSAKQPEQPCEACRRPYRPNRPGQRFCCVQCAATYARGLVRAWR